MYEMPMNLVLVRHGESEGNVALHASKKGDNRFFDVPGFRERQGSDWRLTKRGVEQAKAAGTLLHELDLTHFDRYYVSDFIRAKETAAHLGLPNANWFPNIYLFEQLWGRLDVVTRDEMEERFPGAQQHRNKHRFYGAFPGGEWMGEVCLRCHRILDTLARECSYQNVILVCHGNVIWAFRMLLEGISPSEYHRLDTSNDPEWSIANGQIEQYTRRKPHENELSRSFSWKRWVRRRPNPVTSGWKKIVRPTFTNETLLAEVEKVPRLIEE